ncbi:hypothetical protein NLJ89_g3890 [Agrocybe chaxingu]|uniref:Uncharacterized protein n=1 Tax=Agrocybe chaxingu TaxID=84603 RepID=A0A9W8K4E0_9AGAR|nr:hypothetical protein NLJ89_g3890 [Agrocybe chaxingu]
MLIDLQAFMKSEDEDKVEFSYLDKDTIIFLQSRLFSLCQIIEVAQNVENRRKGGFYFCGKEHQVAWNALLCVFCSSEEDAVSPNLFFKRTIDYPLRDIRASEGTMDHWYLSNALAQAHHQRHIVLGQYSRQVYDPNSTGDGRIVTLHVLGKSESICGHFERSMSTKMASTLTSAPAPTSAELAEATSKDPAYGRTDAMLCVPIPVLPVEPSEAALQSVPSDVVTLEPVLPHSYSRLLPILVVLYDMPTENIEKVFNKCRMSCVAAVESLSALGVYDFPVFGFTMGGTRAWVLMAWKSTKVVEPEKVASWPSCSGYYIMDHNLTSFDISVPTEALQFAITLYRINQHQQKIRDRL